MKEVIFNNRDKNDIIEEIRAVVPPIMFNNPAFIDMINSLFSKYNKLIVDNGKVILSNNKKENYNDNIMDSISNLEMVEVSLDDQNNLVYDLTSNSLIRQYHQEYYNTDYEYSNHLSTNYEHKVFAPDGLEELAQIYHDTFDTSSSKMNEPRIDATIYRPKFRKDYVDAAELTSSASAKTAVRNSIPNTVGIFEQEKLGTLESTNKRSILPTDIQHPLYIQVPYGAKPYNEEFDRQDVMEREIMSDFLEKIEAIKESDERAYEVFLKRAIKAYGSLDNLKMEVEKMGLESKFESRSK